MTVASMQSMIVGIIVGAAVALVARSVLRQWRALRTASRGPAGCDAGCGCDAPSTAGNSANWDEVAPATRHVRR